MQRVIFSNMRNEDFSTLSSRVLETLNRFDIKSLGMDSVVNSLNEANVKMNDFSAKSELNVEKYNAVVKQDNCLRLYAQLRFYVQSFLVSEGAYEVEAAARIWKLISVYEPNSGKMSQKHAMLKIGTFISEIEKRAKNKKAIAVLKATKRFDLLKASYAKVNRITQERVVTNHARNQSKATDGCNAIRSAIVKLYKYVDNMTMLSNKPEFEELEQQLSKIAKRHNDAILARSNAPRQKPWRAVRNPLVFRMNSA